MTLGKQFEINTYQQPTKDIVIFDLVSPIEERINGELCSIDRITFSNGISIEGEDLKARRKVKFVSPIGDGLIHFPDSSNKSAIVIRGRKINVRIEKNEKELNQEKVLS